MGQTLIPSSEILSDTDVLFVFGSAAQGRLSKWLKENETRYLVFVEEEESLFLKAKENPFFSSQRVRLFYLSEEIYSQLSWEFVLMRFGYCCEDPEREERASAFFARLEHFHRGVDLLASDSQDMGVKVLKNAYANLKHLPRSKLCDSLKNTCAGIPAILCGAGPSLDAALALLGDLADRALIIAGGSAVKALNAQGVTPHLYLNVDPEPPYRRFLEQDQFSQPFFYQGRLSSELLDMVPGPLVWIPDSGSYPLENWLASECGIFTEPFDSGWTVSNVAASLAAHLGCSPIICIGMDFACGKETVYASGLSAEKNAEELIEVQPGVFSKKDWVMSAEWMGSCALKFPHLQWINASEGGIPLQGFKTCSLPEAVKGLPESVDIGGLAHALVTRAAPSGVSDETVLAVRHKMLSSFEKCASSCDDLLKVWEKYYPHSPLEKGDYALLEVELEQQPCYRHFLLPLWNVWSRPILRGASHPLEQHIHRLLFFKRALEAHVSYLRSDACMY
ncbi:MAG: 6-hydroxymethylpterin diphosphokinase MptE-like protein [Chlamydiota bacterium]